MKAVLRIILLYILEFLHFLIVIPFLTLVALSVTIVVILAIPPLILALILDPCLIILPDDLAELAPQAHINLLNYLPGLFPEVGKKIVRGPLKLFD